MRKRQLPQDDSTTGAHERTEAVSLTAAGRRSEEPGDPEMRPNAFQCVSDNTVRDNIDNNSPGNRGCC